MEVGEKERIVQCEELNAGSKLSIPYNFVCLFREILIHTALGLLFGRKGCMMTFKRSASVLIFHHDCTFAEVQVRLERQSLTGDDLLRALTLKKS